MLLLRRYEGLGTAEAKGQVKDVVLTGGSRCSGYKGSIC